MGDHSRLRMTSNLTTTCLSCFCQTARSMLTKAIVEQEIRAIAKMTARCALYMSPWVRPRLFFPKFLMSFVPIDTKNVCTKFEVRSFSHSWDNGVLKKFGQTLDTPTLPFSKFLMDFCSDRPFECTCQIWSSCDNRGTQKYWAIPAYAHTPFSPKFLLGVCSDGPCEYIGQIWSP